MSIALTNIVPLRAYRPSTTGLQDISMIVECLLNMEENDIRDVVEIAINHLDQIEPDSDFEPDDPCECNGDEMDYSCPEPQIAN